MKWTNEMVITHDEVRNGICHLSPVQDKDIDYTTEQGGIIRVTKYILVEIGIIRHHRKSAS